MADKLAWFPFFVDRWETDEYVKTADFKEHGMYIALLCWQWREGAIPADLEKLKRGLSLASRGVDSDEPLRRLLTECFVDHPSEPGKFVNSFLYEVSERQRVKSSKLAKAGRKGALNRARASLQPGLSIIEREDIQGTLLETDAGSSEKFEAKTELPMLPPRRGNSLQAVDEHWRAISAEVALRARREDFRRYAAELLFSYWCLVFKHPGAKLDDAREKPIIRALKANGDDVSELLYVIDGASNDDWATETPGRHDTDYLFRNRSTIEKYLTSDRFKAGKPHKVAVRYGLVHAENGAQN